VLRIQAYELGLRKEDYVALGVMSKREAISDFNRRLSKVQAG
jgi:hypothetical protein